MNLFEPAYVVFEPRNARILIMSLKYYEHYCITFTHPYYCTHENYVLCTRMLRNAKLALRARIQVQFDVDKVLQNGDMHSFVWQMMFLIHVPSSNANEEALRTRLGTHYWHPISL